MTDSLDLTGSQILAIPLSEPQRMFHRRDLVGQQFRQLSLRWHPDRGGDEAVMAHITQLHANAKRLAENDEWPGELRFESNGKAYVLRYFRAFGFELGMAYLNHTRITYVINKDFADLAQHARMMIERLKFPNDEVKRVMSRYLPVIAQYYELNDGRIVMMVEKPADLIRMRDLLDHLGGKVDPRHVAWMVSRMLNHVSYFELTELVHHDLSLDTLFVCPEQHTVCVLGGWWYACAAGEKLNALPTRTAGIMPSLTKSQVASTNSDLTLIRLTARELLGNSNGIVLAGDRDIPVPMLNWLRLPGSNSALTDYTQWDKHILPDSFGPRKFVKLPVSASDVYAE